MILVCILLLSAMCTNSFAEAIVAGDYEYTVLQNGTVSIDKYLGKDTQVKVPASIDGKRVTEIGNDAFSAWDDNALITIPDSLITEVVLPDGLTRIGRNAFALCGSMVKISIPQSVTYIDYAAFAGCRSLTDVILPDNLTIVSESLFTGCESLTSLKIPDSVTSIERDAFSSCSNLTEINIPNSVTSIEGNLVFSHCNALRTIYVAEDHPVFQFANGLLIDRTDKKLIFSLKGETNYRIPTYVNNIGEFACFR